MGQLPCFLIAFTALAGTSATALQEGHEHLCVGSAAPARGAASALATPEVNQVSAGGNAIVLLSQVEHSAMGSSGASDCWGYTSPSGREYAIICLDDQTAFVEVTDPATPVVISTKNGPSSTWRDAKVYQDHCYVVSEGGSGIQVFDMSNIDNGSVATLPDVTTGGNFDTHNVAIDLDSGFLYRCGGASNDGLRIYDLNQSLASPPYVGAWSNKYVHDAQIVTYTSGPAAGKQVAYCLTGNELAVVNVTNKSNPSQMDTVTWPGLAYAHQGWLDENQQYFYINDEQDELNFGVATTTIVVDVSDPSNVVYVGKFDNGQLAIGHNGYIRGDLLYEANNSSGLRVFDLSVDPLNPPEIGWYDTSTGEGATFEGLWSVYPYFPSGLVIGSDRSEGLFVWFDELLVDIVFDVPPPPFLLPSGQVLPLTLVESSAGTLQPGTAALHYDDGGGWQSLPLVSLGGGSYEAQFPALTCGSVVRYYLSAESTNGFTWNEPFGGQAAPIGSLVASGSTDVFSDDFEQNLGWVAENVNATAGDFDRGVPVDDPGWPFDPFEDADGSGQCWLTENALGNTDVDNGSVRITSPPLDLSGATPVVQYDYYLYITDETGLDFLKVKANDNAGSGWQTVANHDTSGLNEWRRGYIQANDFITAGVSLSSNVLLRFSAKDSDPQTTVEAGVDGFKVLELSCSPVISYCTPGTTSSGCQVSLTATGVPSLSLPSGFTVSGQSGEGSKDGLFFFAQNGQQATPWGNGTSYQCVAPPVQRTPVQPGVGTNGNCDGSWSLDLNAWAASNPAKAPAAGVPTQLQFWFRDPANTSNQTTSLSDALDFVVAP